MQGWEPECGGVGEFPKVKIEIKLCFKFLESKCKSNSDVEVRLLENY